MKKAIIIISILAAAFAAFIVIFPDKNPLKKWLTKSHTDPLNPKTPLTTGTTATDTRMPERVTNSEQYRLGFPLTKGSKGTYVMALQAALNKKYYTNLVVDGIFGAKTYRALSVNGFNPDAVTFADYQKIIS